MISDTQSIGGSGVKVWDSRDIPGYPAGSNVIENIKTYILSPQGESYTFQYPADKIVTVYEGGQLQLPDPGGKPPYTYNSDNSNVATVDSSGRATLHDTGSVKLRITDSAGKKWQAEFSPSLYMYSAGSDTAVNFNEALTLCESLNGRMPSSGELTSGQWVRAVGALRGEWGDCTKNGFVTTTMTEAPAAWASDGPDVILIDGNKVNNSHGFGVTNQVVVLTSFFDTPYTDIVSYVLSPQGEPQTFSYPANKFVTVYDGAQLQLPDPGGVPPYTYKSSDNYLASVDATGRAKIHNTGTFQLRIIDSTGKQWGAEFSPSLYMLAGGYTSPFEDAQPWCESVGGRLPTRSELSHNGSGRFIGSLFGEWGDCTINDFMANFESGPTSWTSDADKTDQWVVRLDIGQNLSLHPGSYCTNQVAVLERKP